MRRAARLGDGWMPYLYSPRRYAVSATRIRELAAEAGRSLDGFRWFVFVFVNVDHDGDRARDGVARTMGGVYDTDFRAIIDRVAVAGTPAEVRDKLLDFVDAGARHFIFLPAPGPAGDTNDIVRRLIEDVVPEVRAFLTRIVGVVASQWSELSEGDLPSREPPATSGADARARVAAHRHELGTSARGLEELERRTRSGGLAVDGDVDRAKHVGSP